MTSPAGVAPSAPGVSSPLISKAPWPHWHLTVSLRKLLKSTGATTAPIKTANPVFSFVPVRPGQLFDKMPRQTFLWRGHGQETEEVAWYRQQNHQANCSERT